MRTERETDLVRACLTWLQIAKPQGVFWRVDAKQFAIQGVYRNEGNYNRSPVPSFYKRSPVPLFVECKVGKGKQSAKQKQFQKAIERAGGTYLLVRSVEELEKGLP
jgi:hypothetical protein